MTAIRSGIKDRSGFKYITGGAQYVDDIYLPRMVYAGFVRSPYAHARIRSIRFPSAEREGLLLGLSGEEAKELSRPIPSYLYLEGDVKIPHWWCLAVDEVNFVGEAVAAVVGESRYNVQDLVDAVEVDYEPLKPVVSAEEAIRDGAPLVHDYLGSNVAIRMRLGGGDVTASFAAADLVIRRRFRMHRHSPSPLEARGALASYEESTGRLTLWASTQLPFILRSHLAQILDLPESKVRVIATDVGGAFGSKIQISPEYIAVCLLSIRCRRPVKWVETRSESLAAFVQAREQIHEVEAAFTREGRLLAIRDRALLDAGAYLDTRISGPALCSIYTLQGPYKIKALDAEISIVLTNKCPYGPYRGFGFQMGTLVVERLMNIAARELGLSPIEIRLRNLIRPEDMPFTLPLGFEYDPIDFTRALRLALEMANYEGARREQEELRSKGGLMGLGLALAIEGSSANTYTGVVEPGEVTSTVDFGTATIRMDATGRVTVFLGTASVGTGHGLAVKEIVSRELSIEKAHVEVVEGDTDLCPYDCGVRASRFSTILLPAVLEATRRLKDRLLRVGALLLDADPSEVELEGGQVKVKSDASRSVSLERIARNFYANVHRLPPDLEPELKVTYTFKPERRGFLNAFSFAVHVPIVVVDPETGTVRFKRYVVVEDCGNVVNKAVVDGQVMGGVAQVVGGIFYEEIRYDEEGQLLTRTFADYLLPTAKEAPKVEIGHLATPSRFPGGHKGMSESSNIAGYAAIVNAIDDALAPLGVEVNETNLRPEKIWRLLYESPGT